MDVLQRHDNRCNSWYNNLCKRWMFYKDTTIDAILDTIICVRDGCSTKTRQSMQYLIQSEKEMDKTLQLLSVEFLNRNAAQTNIKWYHCQDGNVVFLIVILWLHLDTLFYSVINAKVNTLKFAHICLFPIPKTLLLPKCRYSYIRVFWENVLTRFTSLKVYIFAYGYEWQQTSRFNTQVCD